MLHYQKKVKKSLKDQGTLTDKSALNVWFNMIPYWLAFLFKDCTLKWSEYLREK